MDGRYNVSTHLMEQFNFRCVTVDNKDVRLDLEERLIATLAYCPDCCPSENWLGKFAANEKIRLCGLWNDQHVNSNKVSARYLLRLKKLVQQEFSKLEWVKDL